MRGICLASLLLLLCAALFGQQSEKPAAESAPTPPPHRLHVEHFGTLFLDAQNNLTATDILARWRDYTIHAEELHGNLDRGEYLFQGSIRLEGGGITAQGNMLRLNVRRRWWQIDNGGGDLLPEFLRYQLRGPVRLSGKNLQGEEREVRLQHGEVTTCLLEHPHYYFSADKVDVVVDKRLVARGVSLTALNRKLFNLPTLVIPLDRRFSRGTLPQVGQSTEEGYYVKTALGYLLGDNAGTARIDLMQKKGIGLGVDQQYLLAGATGLLSLYYLNDRSRDTQTVTAQLQHQQKLFGFDARLTGDLRSGSYLYYSDTRASSWQLALNRSWTSGSLALTSRISQQDSAGYSSDATLSSLRWSQRWGGNTGLTLSTDLSRFRSFSNGTLRSEQQQLSTQAVLNGTTDKIDWTLAFNRIVPVGGQQSGFYYGGMEKTPELVLSTTDRKLFNRDLGLRMDLGIGSFRELPQGQPIQRILFEARWTPPSSGGSNRSLSYSGTFRQIFTSDGTAQYVLQGNLNWQVRFGSNSRYYTTYQYVRPYGFTPLRTDYAGTTNFASAGIEWNSSRTLSLRAYTGYDLFARQRGSRPWQPLNVGLLWQPSKNWELNVQSTLNLNEGQWNYLRAYLRGRGERFATNLNGVYDPIRHRWASANLWLDVPVFNIPLRVQAYLTYNGYVRRFEGRQLLLTWDLHCWEMSVGYIDNPLGFRADREVVFRLRIKAFPEVQRFGVGQFGQSLESMGGWQY